MREDVALCFRPPHFLGGRGKSKLLATAELANSIIEARVGDTVAPPASLVTAPFKADRARFLAVDSSELRRHRFDPAPWLHPFEAACYLEPRIIEHDAGRRPLPQSKFGADRSEAIKFAKMLDRAGRLYLADETECPAADRMNLLAAF